MKYKCEMCGEVYDEERRGVKFADLPESWVCPICGVPKAMFKPMEEPKIEKAEEKIAAVKAPDLTRSGIVNAELEMATEYIHKIASEGKMIVEPSGAKTNLSPWSEILVMAAQLDRKPIEPSVPVKLETVIGKKAKQPLVLPAPITVSHMSYGSLSGEMKTAIAKGAGELGLPVSSGEGGLYEPEIETAAKFIFEYVPHKYGINDENLRRIDAIEIKVGQSAKPGLGGHLPGAKVTAEIAKMRGFPEGQDITSPSAFEEINSPEDLKRIVDELKERTGGKPVGVKIAANEIEKDLAWVKVADPDYITLDGRGGGTGSAPRVWKENSGVPTLYAVVRARKYLNEQGMEQSLIVTGGVRTAGEILKCLALGADAVALGTAVLTALAAPGEMERSEKVKNFLKVTMEELAMMTRASGLTDIAEFSQQYLQTTNEGIAKRTEIRHVLD